MTRLISIAVAILAIGLSGFTGNAQQLALDSLQYAIGNKDIEKAYRWSSRVDTTALSAYEKAWFLEMKGLTYAMDEQSAKAFYSYLKSRDAYHEIDSLGLEANLNLQLAGLISSEEVENVDYKPYLDAFLAYAKQQDDPALLAKAYLQAGSSLIEKLPSKTLSYFKKALKQSEIIADTIMVAKTHHNIGVVYAEKLKKLDSALYHYALAEKVYRKNQLHTFLAYIYNNQAAVYKMQERYDLAIESYLKADSLPLDEYRKGTKSIFYKNLSEAYASNGEFEKALDYTNLQRSTEDSLLQTENQTQIRAIERKYNVERQENLNLKLRQNRNRWVAALIAATLLLIIAFVSYRNAVVKRKLAEQERNLNEEKLNKALKEHELDSLDAMLIGQEKERRRIANDLHDNLGGLLATLKLHFQNFKVKTDRLREEEDALYNTTDELIDEAYQKVRTMAHAKNAGLPAKEGLLPAVKNFAAKVSIANRLVIEVIDYGMDTRLENNVEITIFRIIQELITNIIKHAEAKHAVIYLTQHEDKINVMVEDNGLGFDLKQVNFNKGMGISSIQTRVDNLNGTFKVDSSPGRGTTIIIDIPIS